MMAEQTGDHVSDLIRKSYQAFLSRDKKTMADLLSDDFIFTSPQDDHLDKSAYFKICFPNSGEFRSHHIEQLFVHGGEALVRYQAELKDGTRFRNVEYFQIDGNKIKAVEVYFGAGITPARDREDNK